MGTEKEKNNRAVDQTQRMDYGDGLSGSGAAGAAQPATYIDELNFDAEDMAERNTQRLEEAVDWLHDEKAKVSFTLWDFK